MLRRFKGRKVDQIFNMVDTDGSGRIDRLELKVLLRKLGLFHMFPGKVIDAIFDAIDLDKNGTIERDEFEKFADPDFTHGAVAAAGAPAHLVHMHKYNRRAVT